MLQGFTPLMLACASGTVTIVSYLLSLPIDVNKLDEVSCVFNAIAILMNVCVQHNKCALDYACLGHRLDVAEMLVRNGADVDNINTVKVLFAYILCAHITAEPKEAIRLPE